MVIGCEASSGKSKSSDASSYSPTAEMLVLYQMNTGHHAFGFWMKLQLLDSESNWISNAGVTLWLHCLIVSLNICYTKTW